MIAPTPWIERKFDFNFPVSNFPIIIERLRGAIPRMENLIAGKEESLLSKKINNKWSVKEVIGHLSDIEALWIGRIDDFLAAKETLRAADMTNAKTVEANHNAKTAEVLIAEFILARTGLLEKVMDFDEDTASLVALHPRLQKPMRLVDSLFFAAEHDDHELTKIRNLLS